MDDDAGIHVSKSGHSDRSVPSSVANKDRHAAEAEAEAVVDDDDYIEDRIWRAVKVGAASFIFYACARHVHRRFFSEWFTTLDVDTGRLADGYFLSAVNTTICTFFGVREQIRNRSSSKAVHRRSRLFQDLGASVTGYFVHDLFVNRQQLWERPDDLFHHVAGFLVTVPISLASRRTMSVLPAAEFFSLEASTLPLNLAFLLRHHGHVRLAGACTRLFAGLFFLLRMVWLPYLIYRTERDNGAAFSRLRTARIATYLLTVLQYYWGSIILRKLIEKLTGASSADSS